jgi:4-aminobutyrate aminotransferase-like enzyme
MPSPVRLRRGDLLPRMLCPPPGPRSRALGALLAAAEAPVVNTWYRGEPALVWEEARGSNVLDVDGNRYLDFTSGFGVAAIGHRHPAVVRAVSAQSHRLLHGMGDVFAHPARAELARRLAAAAPFAGAQVYFAISGAEAVEIALKTALLATGRSRLLGFVGGYHGLTLGALALTSRPAFRRPFLSAINPHAALLPYGAPASALAAALAPGDVAAVVVEPILGREGVVLPPPGWLAELGALCRRHGTLLLADEILTGGGRTGSFWALEEEAVPDLLCCGKALGGGLPFAAVLARADLFAAWQQPGEALHTATFLAHPLATAAALAALEVIAGERLVDRAVALGQQLAPALAELATGHRAAVRAVRGRGAWWALELASAELASQVVAAAQRRGLLLLAGGPAGRVLQLVPPLVLTDRQLAVALDLLAQSLAAPTP